MYLLSYLSAFASFQNLWTELTASQQISTTAYIISLEIGYNDYIKYLVCPIVSATYTKQ